MYYFIYSLCTCVIMNVAVFQWTKRVPSRNWKKCFKCVACWTYLSVTKSLFHGYCFLNICWDVWNGLSYSLHCIVKCWRRHSAVLKKKLLNLSLAHYRGDEIPLIYTCFEICHVCFASPHHLNQILRYYSPAETDSARFQWRHFATGRSL